tara:strand:- start:1345 stop:1599 length:255 start_codon:yes stop_codon:yes gene_type:complete
MKFFSISIKNHLKSPFVWIALLYLLTTKAHLLVIDSEYSVKTAEAIIDHRSPQEQRRSQQLAAQHEESSGRGHLLVDLCSNGIQ